MRKIISLFIGVVLCLFISVANAQLHVDIVAGGTDPISIAVQNLNVLAKCLPLI